MDAPVKMINNPVGYVEPYGYVKFYRTEHTILPFDSESNNVEKPNFIQKYPFEKIANGPAPKLMLITNAEQYKNDPVDGGSGELIYKRATEKENKKILLLAIRWFANQDQLMQKPFTLIDEHRETLGDNEKCENRNDEWYYANIERIKSMPENTFLTLCPIRIERKIFTITGASSSQFQQWTLNTWSKGGIITPVMLQELRSKILKLSLDELIVCCDDSKDRTGVTLCIFLALDVVPVVMKEFYAKNETIDPEQLENLTNNIANFLLHTIRRYFSPEMCEVWAENGLKELIRLDVTDYDVKSVYTPFYEWEGGDLKKLYADYVANPQ